MILVTGAAGHIGNALMRALHARGYRNLRAMALPGENVSHIAPFAAEVVRGDVRRSEDMLAAAAGCSGVFHLAGMVTISNRHQKRVMDINFGGTQKMVQACLRRSVKRLVFFSTTDALHHPETGCLTETPEPDIRRLKSVYAQSKAMAMAAVQSGVQKGLCASIVCPSAVFGPFEYGSSPIGRVIRAYIEAGKTQLYFDGWYNFVDVRDVADGALRAFERGDAGHVYILSGWRKSVQDMMDAVQAATGRQIRRRKIPAPLALAAGAAAPLAYLFSPSGPPLTKNAVKVLLAGPGICADKTRAALGISPRPFAQSIADTVEWYLAGRAK